MTDKKPLKMNLQFFAEGDEQTETTDKQEAVEETVTEEVTEKSETVEKSEEEVNPETTEPAISTGDNTAELENRIATLTAENSELQKQLAKANEIIADLTGKAETTKTTVAEATAKAETYQETLEKIVAEKEQTIPNNIKALMPKDISVTDKLDWLNKAEALKQETEATEVITEIGRPTPVTEKVVDQSDLTSEQKMSNYFSKFFGGK